MYPIQGMPFLDFDFLQYMSFIQGTLYCLDTKDECFEWKYEGFGVERLIFRMETLFALLSDFLKCDEALSELKRSEYMY